MTYPSLLFTSPVPSMPRAGQLSRQVEDENIAERARLDAPEWESDEAALPSGIVSMQHWLDLNA